jgi:DNA mismatch endonuclease, patch repair protein
MADVFTPKKRSEIMSRIGGKDTAPEVRVRRLLHALGFRFRLHRSDLPGKPDIVLPRHRKIILVHGCFWHSHADCPRAALPTTNPEFWRAKVEGNVARDRRVCTELGDRLLKFIGGTERSATRVKRVRTKSSVKA